MGNPSTLEDRGLAGTRLVYSKLKTFHVDYRFIKEYDTKLQSKPVQISVRKVSAIFEIFLARIPLKLELDPEFSTLSHYTIVEPACLLRNPRSSRETWFFPKKYWTSYLFEIALFPHLILRKCHLSSILNFAYHAVRTVAIRGKRSYMQVSGMDLPKPIVLWQSEFLDDDFRLILTSIHAKFTTRLNSTVSERNSGEIATVKRKAF